MPHGIAFLSIDKPIENKAVVSPALQIGNPMSLLTIEGIILHSLKFQDYDQIATVFTFSHGLIKVMIKGAFRPKNKNKPRINTLDNVELVCRQGRSDMWTCQEISTLNFHLKLRESLERLEAALEMAQDLLSSQAPGKNAPELFQLFKKFLEKLPHSPYPQTLAVSFRLKILRYEGVLNILPLCSQCHAQLEVPHLWQGESYCRQHAPPYALSLPYHTAGTFHHLAHCLSFKELSELEVSPLAASQSRQLFKQLI